MNKWMISNNKIKLIRSLRLKKFRQKNQLIIVEGSKIIGELIKQFPELIEEIWYLPNAAKVVHDKFNQLNSHVIGIDEMKKISSLESMPDAFALVNYPNMDTKAFNQNLILFLDDVQDPGNVGTIIRTAEWFGHKSIICSPRCADRFGAKVVQSSMGSVFRVHVNIMEWVDVQDKFTDYDYCYADMKGENINNWVKDVSKAVVVIGNEGNGVNEQLKKNISSAISINGSPNKLTESLNASIATGIILHTWGPLI